MDLITLIRNNNQKNKIEKKIPKNEDNEVWWAITKRFKWSEVESYINKIRCFISI